MKLHKIAVWRVVGLLLSVIPAQAVNLEFEKLVDSEDYAAVLESRDRIMGFANTLFRENGISEISAEGVDWNAAYKIYI